MFEILVLAVPVLVAWGFGWLINLRFARAPDAFPPFIVGFLGLNLLAQALFVFGLPIKYLPYALAGLCLMLILGRRRSDLSPGRLSRAGWHRLAAPAAVAILLTLPCLLGTGSAFHGHYWGDAIHYDLLSNYLYHLPTAPDAAAIFHPEYDVVRDSGLLATRLGQSFTQAACAALTRQPTPELFYATTFLSVLLFYHTAAYFLRRHTPVGFAAWAAAAFSVAPAFLLLNYDCFQSQALATPVFLFVVVALTEPQAPLAVYRLTVATLGVNYVLATYPELTPLMLLPIGLVLLFCFLRLAGWRLLAHAAIGLSAGALLFFFSLGGRFSALANITHSTIGSLNGVFPQAYKASGLAALYFGELAMIAPEPRLLLLFLASAVCGGLGICALVHWAISRRDASALCFSLLVLCPWAIPLFFEGRTYQFYKLLLSFSPLGLIGIFLHLGNSAARPARRWLGPAIGGMALVGALSVVLPAGLARSKNSFLSKFTQRQDPEQIVKAVRAQSPERVLLSTPSDASYESRCTNGLLALALAGAGLPFQSSLAVLGDAELKPYGGRLDLPINASYPHYLTAYREIRHGAGTLCLVQNGTPFLRPSTRLFVPGASIGRVTISHYTGSRPWVLVQSVRTTGPVNDERCALPPGATLVLAIEADAAIEKGVVLQLEYEPPRGAVSWHVYSSAAFGFVFKGAADRASINSGPLAKGVTEVYLTPVFPDSPPAEAATLNLSRVTYGDLLPDGEPAPWLAREAPAGPPAHSEYSLNLKR